MPTSKISNLMPRNPGRRDLAKKPKTPGILAKFPGLSVIFPGLPRLAGRSQDLV